tara:strand:- start:341 stop:1162 length:822 start_codon:yes stop_codon:yes gene_type:complete
MIENKKPRTLVNLIGAPLLLSTIYFGGSIFTLFIFVVIFISTYEFNNMIKLKSFSLCLPIFYFVYLIFLCFYLFVPISDNILQLFLFSCLLIIILSSFFNVKENKLQNMIYSLLAFFWIGLLFQGAIYLRNLPEIGFKIVFCMFLSVWITDSFAYIFGKKFGKAKILPKISPNKTWVGCISGYLSCTVFLYLLYEYNYFANSFYTFNLVDVIILGLISGVFGQAGDFFESYLKRSFSIKDSGTLLQGHGGFLDRFDSLLFVVPLFAYYYYLVL